MRKLTMEKLTRQQWYELDEQFSRTPVGPFSSEQPGEHMKLIALLNRFGYQPMAKQQALKLAIKLLDLGWQRRITPHQTNSTPVVVAMITENCPYSSTRHGKGLSSCLAQR
jgi:hypothetical protein